VVVPNDQLSLAIGKKGQNARLASRLIGWNIDIKSAEDPTGTSIVASLDPDESLVPDAAEVTASAEPEVTEE